MSAIKLITSAESLASYAGSLTVPGAVTDLTLTDPFTDDGGNTVSPTGPARAIRVGTIGSGALKVRYASGVVSILTKLRAGDMVSGKFAAVYASGSDVQDITVFW